ncbi:hypothetical protein [uncultured Lutibacter sp.]|uniref:hypothetical protein n=1 Tax=uncultured Lutibacter sp. TaxID=437739 RepID=UPI00261FA5EC|nr:hypothetical protein [uncultured Lutibacter sp.]
MSDISSQDLVKVLADRIVKYNVALVKNVGVDGDDSLEVSGKKELSDLLETLYRNSVRDNFYFFDCPLDVYKETFDGRFTDFKKINIDADVVDFMKSEFKILHQVKSRRVLQEVNYHAFSVDLECFNISIFKKRNFLKKELKKKGVFVINEPVVDVSPFDDVPLDDEVRFAEKDVTGVLTSNQVVILLDKIGFFADTRIEEKTQGEQAELISMITGYNVKNIKTYIKKLDDKSFEISDNYKKDLKFINSLLNSK